MKLYSTIANERGVSKGQGGNKSLKISLMHEEEGKKYTERTITIDVLFEWNDGKPKLQIKLPDGWEADGQLQAYFVGGTQKLKCPRCHESDTVIIGSQYVCSNCKIGVASVKDDVTTG